MPQFIEVSHVSNSGSSVRITPPKKIEEKLGVKEEDILGFYEEDGKIFVKKMERKGNRLEIYGIPLENGSMFQPAQ